MPSLKVSAWLSVSWPTHDVLAVASEAEQAGYHGIWLADHFMVNTETIEPSDSGLHECFSLLAGLAVAVPRVRLGSLVAGTTYRHPAVLAKMAATIDHLSGGRLVLGIGTGWQLNEHAAYGIELGSIRERIDRFEEGIEIIRGLLTEQRTTVHGTYYTVSDAPLEPKPVQSRLPLLIGAKGEQRMLAIVAAAADEWNCWSTPEVFARKTAALDAHCTRIGRDPLSIWRTTQAKIQLDEAGPPSDAHATITGSIDRVVDTVGRWQSLGLNEWIIPSLDTPAQTRDLLGRVMNEAMPQLS